MQRLLILGSESYFTNVIKCGEYLFNGSVRFAAD